MSQATTHLVQAFHVNKGNFRQTRAVSHAQAAPAATEVLFRIERFALTANNITYASFGDSMKYWDFFPVSNDSNETKLWGQVPVWGFACVQAIGSQVDANAFAIGEKFYGYFPMASHITMAPATISPLGFSDSAAHRAHLHPLYNQYRRCSADTGYSEALEANQMLVQPLFMTSFLIEDFLFDQQYFGAKQVIITSASSKTSYSLAHMMSRRDAGLGDRPKVIGLTSPNNAVFVNGLGVYSKTIGYGEIQTLDNRVPTMVIDMAGNSQVRAQIHEHWQDTLTYSCAVGGTHWEQLPGRSDATGSALPGPKPTLFFAPAQAKKRATDWGSKALNQAISKAWLEFQPTLGQWMHVLEASGQESVAKTYADLLDGKAAADQGYVLSLS